MSRFAALAVHQKRKANAPGDGILQRKCACGQDSGKDSELLRKKRQGMLQRSAVRQTGLVTAPSIVHDVLRSPGQPLEPATRAFMEPRFGHEFAAIPTRAHSSTPDSLSINIPGDVFEQQADTVADRLTQPSAQTTNRSYDLDGIRVHTDSKAAKSAAAVNALAYTVGNDIIFGAGQYNPYSTSGQRLIAHELAHVVQQTGEPRIQRTLGDGHDLTSPRFSLMLDLEAAYDGEKLIERGSQGRGVQAIQQALYDLGYRLPAYGADGDFGSETVAAVKDFQKANPPLKVDGIVGKNTMAALDVRFGKPTLPPAATLSATWTPACVQSVLCPWSPHTIDVLRTRITLKSFDDIGWDDERWTGSAWVIDRFPGGGYNTGTEIGVLNSSCEDMSQTLYHEVLHAEQPTTQRTTLQKESYAYRIGEEFSIAMGFKGRPSLRSKDPQGREFADRAKIKAFLAPGGAAGYPGVTAGGGGEQIIGKATTFGYVRVQRANGSIYTRPAAVGEKVPGPMTVKNEVTHKTSTWKCP